MLYEFETQAADAEKQRRLFTYNGGFLTQKRVRRILQLSGYSLRLGLPRGTSDLVGVWGHSPTAHRGEAIAARRGAPIVRIEDAFLRSLHPGRSGSMPLGLTIDHGGMHYDPAQPSDLEQLLTENPLDNSSLLKRARGAIERMQESHLTKYTGFDPETPCPKPGYVLVIDQTFEDAAVVRSGADRTRFLEMLVFAQEENPGAKVLIKTHPETQSGHRKGYYSSADVNHNVKLWTDPVSPWRLMEGAIAVYTVSSQMGFEAIMAGHKPRVFGQPFYAGWGLTQDEYPPRRRGRTLTRPQLFAGAMMLYPKWYDPHRDCLCDFETAMDALDAETRAWREDRHGWTASGMRMWKRKPLQRFFGTTEPMTFADTAPTDTARRHMVWASGKMAENHPNALRLEDGFIRSKGLGAALVPPMSLVLDDLGIYYDPTKPSRLEDIINRKPILGDAAETRTALLIERVIASGVSKYNTGTQVPELPAGHVILVPGQVEDDASIRTGTRDVSTNLGLLELVRAENPDAIIAYKPHPDVEAGLRSGQIEPERLNALADVVLTTCDPISAIMACDEVWTMTSLLGFEALMRGTPVTCVGTPFYAGWGLTRDIGPSPARRRKDISLNALVHAALIAYPRYFDPKTGTACSVEIVLDRLETGTALKPSATNRVLSKLQGVFASQAHLWRR